MAKVENEQATRMNDDSAISITGISKCYHLYERPMERLKQMLWGGSHHKEFFALNDVSFTIKKGEAVGIIGRNGSGKSTLLQIIAGTLKPTIGEIMVKGRVAALLELGCGFNPEFTGRENTFLNGAILGFSHQEMESRFDEIVAFADIGEFIDQPVKTYSSGMMMRLAFAIQIAVEPDILIVDEALSVGDFFFQQKCFNRIRQMHQDGMTLLFVSHDMGTVRDICSRAIYLRKGQAHFVGETSLAIRQYLTEREGVTGFSSQGKGSGEIADVGELDTIRQDAIWVASADNQAGGAKLSAVALYDAGGEPTTSFTLGGIMCIKVAYVPAIAIPTHVNMTFRNKYNQVVTSVGSSRLDLAPPNVSPGQTLIFEMSLHLLLEAGNYAIDVALGELVSANIGNNMDTASQLGPISIHWDYEHDKAPFLGMCGLPTQGIFKIGYVAD